MKSKELMIPNIIGYHANTAERCDKFLSGDYTALNSIEDGEWLGNGIYFWDNLSNAQYWRKIKEGKSKEKIKIIQVQFKIEHLLDLTDVEVCCGIELLWQYIAKKLHKPLKAPLGKKLNLLFEGALKNQYDVIRIYGKYPKYGETSLYAFSIDSKNIEPVNYIKCIYALRNADTILKYSEVEDYD